MKSKIILAALVGLYAFLMPSLAQARMSVPIVSYENVIVTTGSGKAVDAAQFRQAMMAAAVAKR